MVGSISLHVSEELEGEWATEVFKNAGSYLIFIMVILVMLSIWKNRKLTTKK